MDTHKVDGMCAHTLKDAYNYGWGSPSHVRNVVQKTRENNQKAGKTNQTINQAPALRPKHDKI
jgi:hypothetical protein